MWVKIKQLLAPPVLEDEEKTRIGRITHIVLLTMFVATLIIPGIYLIRALIVGDPVANLVGVIVVVAGGLLAFLFLNKRGQVYISASMLSLLFLLESFYLIYGEGSLDNPLVINFSIPIIIAGLLLGSRASILTALASAVLIGIASIDEVTSIEALLASRLLAYTGVFLAMSLLIRLATNSISEALTRIRHSNQQLQEARDLLEVRVSDRTRDLLLATEVGRSISQVRNVNELLNDAVEQVRSRFELYYTQVYLVDEDNKSLILTAGTGDIGKQLTKQGHRLDISPTSINGRAVVGKRPIIVADTNSSPIFQSNPLLPETRSEMAVPLIIEDQVIGVLDMQSTSPHTFTEEVLPAFEVLTNQLAIALQNAQRYAQTQALLKEEERLAIQLGNEQRTLQAVLSSMPAGVFVAEFPSGKPILANQKAQEMLGKGIAPDIGAEQLAEVYAAFLTGTDQPYPTEQMPLVRGMFGETSQVDDMEIHRPDGTQLLLEVNGAPIYDAQGQVTASVAIFQDITERQQARDLLQKQASDLEQVAKIGSKIATNLDSLHLLQEVVDLTKSSFNLYHAHIYLLDATEENLNLVAGAGEVGQKMVSQGYTIPLEREQSLVARAARTRQGVIVNNVQDDPGFLSNPLLPDTRAEMAVPLIAGERLVGVLDVQVKQVNYFAPQDINIYTALATQVAVALENARGFEQVKQQAAILESSETLMATATLDGRIQFVNPIGLRWLGATHLGEIVNASLLEFLPDDIELVQTEIIPAVLETGAWHGETTLHSRTGRVIPLEQVVFLIRDKEGQPMLLATNAIDISERKEAEKAQQQLSRQLEERLLQVNQLQRAMTREGWQAFLTAKERVIQGYQYKSDVLRLISTHNMQAEDIEDAPMSVSQVAKRYRPDETTAVAPMEIRGEVVGVLGVHAPSGQPLTEEQRTILSAVSQQVAEALERARLFEETEQALTETEQLYKISARLNTANSVEEMLAAALAPSIETGAAASGLFVFDLDSHGYPEWMEILVNWQRDQKYPVLPVKTRLRVSDFPSNQLWINTPTTPLFFEDTYMDDRFDLAAQQLMHQLQARAIILLPLAIGGHWLGLIYVSWLDPRPFSPQEHRLYRALASQTAVVFNNQLLLQQTQQDADRLSRLSEVQTRLSQAFDESDILKAFAPLVQVEASSSISFIYLQVDEQGQPQIIDIHTNWQNGVTTVMDPPLSYQVKDFPIAQLWIHNPNEVLFVPDVIMNSQLDTVARETLTQVGVQAIAVIPLYSGGQWQGIVSMQWPTPHPFSSDEEFLLQQVQRPLASVVASRRAYLAAEAARHETEQRAAELSVINQVSEIISQQTEFTQLLQTVLEQVRRIMPVESFLVGLYDATHNILSYPLVYDDGQLYNTPDGPPDPRSRVFQVVQTGQPLLINYTPEELAQLQLPTIGKPQLPTGLIYTPLRSGSQVIGAISVQTYHGHYTPANMGILGGIADHLAVAIENTRLFNQTQQRATELAAINEISQAATSHLELGNLIEAVGQKIIQTFTASGGYIAVYHKQSNLIDMAYFIDAATGKRIYVPPLTMGEGITSYIVRSKQPLLVAEATAERMAQLGAKYTDEGGQPHSFLGVPMIVGDEVVGAISLQNMPDKPAFTEADQQLIMTIATTVGVAIQNALLFDQAQRRAERERLVNDITQKIQSAVTVEGALQTAVQELGQSLQARHVRVGLEIATSNNQNGVQ